MDRLLSSQQVVLGLILIVIGTGLTITLVGAVIGIPMMLFGIWLTTKKTSSE